MEIFKKIGSWLFLIGILAALILGVVIGAYGGFDKVTWNTAPVAATLAVLGFIIGILSFFALGTITQDKVPSFLIGTLALVILGVTTSLWSSTWIFGDYTELVPFFTSITTCMAIFAAPAAGLLAIRAIWDAGKGEEVEKIMPKL